MSVHYRVIDNELIIVGHTYPHKDQIKALGARFDREHKAWKLSHSESNHSQVDHLCRQLGGGPLGGAVSAPAPSLGIDTTPTTRPQVEGITVGELMQQADMAVRTAFPRTIWVIGEIQNLSQRHLGVFFELAEQKDGGRSASATTAVKATIWNSTLAHLQAKFAQHKEDLFALLADGMQTRVLCQVSLYKDRGQISLVIMDIDPAFTKGALALAREALLKELRKNGLDQKNKQLPRPLFPFRIGLISAEGSRAQSDFMDQLRTYHFPGEVVFCDARMQGEKTPSEVVAAIHTLLRAEVDLIVITRGGGSAADLRWFDDREVALAVANATIPVVAAIGHHDDVCVAEEIAFQREKTPTAAADFVIHCFQQTRDRINHLADSLALQVERKLEWHTKLLHQLTERLGHSVLTCLNRQGDLLTLWAEKVSHGALRAIERQQFATKTLYAHIYRAANNHWQRASNSLAELEKALVARDPMPWIKKGWTQLFGDQGHIKSVEQLRNGDQLRARLTDGQVYVAVQRIEQENRHES
jgi:exodeoxyribonuclease VII large subunit